MIQLIQLLPGFTTEKCHYYSNMGKFRQGGPHSVLCRPRVDRRMNRESPEDFGSGEEADRPCHELA